jgi:intracellular multiplication protein IcmM
MSREKWKLIRRKKGFYVNTYRKLETILVFFVTLNFVLGFMVMRVYFGQPERQFYATNGVGAPEELIPMVQANVTSVPLLPDDPIDDNVDKAIPQ